MQTVKSTKLKNSIVEETKLQAVRSSGYTGENSLEGLLKLLNKYKSDKGEKKVNNKAWWIDFKNKANKKGVSFEDAVIEALEKLLKGTWNGN